MARKNIKGGNKPKKPQKAQVSKNKIAKKLLSDKNPIKQYAPSTAKKKLTEARKEVKQILGQSDEEHKEWMKRNLDRKKKLGYSDTDYYMYLRAQIENTKNSQAYIKKYEDKLDNSVYTELYKPGGKVKGLRIFTEQMTFGGDVITAPLPRGDAERFTTGLRATSFDLPAEEKYYNADYAQYKLLKTIESADKDFIRKQADRYRDRLHKAFDTILGEDGLYSNMSSDLKDLTKGMTSFQLERLGQEFTLKEQYDYKASGRVDELVERFKDTVESIKKE